MPACSAVASSSGRSTADSGRRSSKAGGRKKTTSLRSSPSGISKDRKSKAAAAPDGRNSVRRATLDSWVVRDSPTATPRAPEQGRGRSPLRYISPDGKLSRHLDVSTEKMASGQAMVIELDVNGTLSTDSDSTHDTQPTSTRAAHVSATSIPPRKNISTSPKARATAAKGMSTFTRKGVWTPPYNSRPAGAAKQVQNYSPPPPTATVDVATTVAESPASPPDNSVAASRGRRASTPIAVRTPPRRKPARKKGPSSSPVPAASTVAGAAVNGARASRGRRATLCPVPPVSNQPLGQRKHLAMGDAQSLAFNASSSKSVTKNLKEAEAGENKSTVAAAAGLASDARSPLTPCASSWTASADVQPSSLANQSTMEMPQAAAIAELEAALAAEMLKLSDGVAGQGKVSIDERMSAYMVMKSDSGGCGRGSSIADSLWTRSCGQGDAETAEASEPKAGKRGRPAKKPKGTIKPATASVASAGPAVAVSGGGAINVGIKACALLVDIQEEEEAEAAGNGDSSLPSHVVANPAVFASDTASASKGLTKKKRSVAEIKEAASSAGALFVNVPAAADEAQRKKKRKSTASVTTKANGSFEWADGVSGGVETTALETVQVSAVVTSGRKNKKRKAPTVETEAATEHMKSPQTSDRSCKGSGKDRGGRKAGEKGSPRTLSSMNNDKSSTKKKKTVAGSAFAAPPSPVVVSKKEFDRMQRIAAAGGFGWRPMPAMRVIPPPESPVQSKIPPPVVATVGPVVAVAMRMPEDVQAFPADTAGGREGVLSTKVKKPAVHHEATAMEKSTPVDVSATKEASATRDEKGWCGWMKSCRSTATEVSEEPQSPPSRAPATPSATSPQADLANAPKDLPTDAPAAIIDPGDHPAQSCETSDTSTLGEERASSIPAAPASAPASAAGGKGLAAAPALMPQGRPADAMETESAHVEEKSMADAGMVEGKETGSTGEEEWDKDGDEVSKELYVMVGDVLKVKCRRCRNRFARAACSIGCFDCCFKAGKPCAAHAKQLERKRVEDALLAGGPSQSQRDEEARRLAKGVFKEEAIHAIGDTATVWCFMDFSRSKSNQGTFSALGRNQRATAGRSTPRSRRAARGKSARTDNGIAKVPTAGNIASGSSASRTGSAGAAGASAVTAESSRRRVRPALARWRRKNAEMLNALRARSQQPE